MGPRRRSRRKLVSRALVCAQFLTLALAGHARAAPSGAAVRLLVPQSPYLSSADEELKALVTEYNAAHPEARVEILSRGQDFSSLKELVAFHLAGDPPELAAVESSELPALRKMNLLRPIRLRGRKESDQLPFRVTVPVLVADRDALAKGERLPSSWRELSLLARRLARPSGNASLALPLQGPQGLWVFEALTGLPLWKREAGGLRSNRQLLPPIEEIQKLIDTPGVLRPDENTERAIQSFVDRKSPLLVTSLDLLPYISKQAAFPWTAGLLPSHRKGSLPLEGGSALIATRVTPEIQAFLEYLYAQPQLSRWLASGAHLPPEGAKAPASPALYAAIASKALSRAPRSTDSDVVRARSEWVQALRLFFGEASRRLPADSVLGQMDRHLNFN